MFLGSCCDNGALKILNISTQLDITIHGKQGQIKSVAFSPVGDHVVSGCDDKAIRIWNAETGDSVGRPLRGQIDSWVRSAQFSPNGKSVVFCTGSGAACIRDIFE